MERIAVRLREGGEDTGGMTGLKGGGCGVRERF